MKIYFFGLLIAVFTGSCSIYRQSFDSFPNQGVPYRSVSELEQMIIETEQGPDLFLGSFSNKKETDGKSYA